MSTAPEPVLGLEADQASTLDPLDEQYEWYEWIGGVALKFSLMGTIVFTTYLGFIAFAVNTLSHDTWIGMRTEVSYWAMSATFASLISSLTGLLLGIHARQTKAGRKAVIVALSAIALVIASIVLIPQITFW